MTATTVGLERRRAVATGRLRLWTGAAATWSGTYAALGVYWMSGGRGFPFGLAADPDATLSALSSVTQAGAAPVIAILGAAGVAVAARMAHPVRNSTGRLALLGFAWAAATVLTVGVPDVRWLVILAYAPIVLVGGLIGWSPDRTLLDVITWPVLNQMLCIGGGVIWAKAALGYARVSSDRCAACGRSDDRSDVPRWARLGPARIAGAVAASVPLLYGVTRWAWAIGIPLGVDAAQLEHVHANGFPIAPAGLGTMAFIGAALTLGLVQRWGEALPRWLPLLGDRRIPVWMVVVPAVFVSLLVTGTGLAIVRFTLDDLESLLLVEAWAVFGPGLVWPVWGVGLGVAAIAYHYRHRGPCAACGRGGA